MSQAQAKIMTSVGFSFLFLLTLDSSEETVQLSFQAEKHSLQK